MTFDYLLNSQFKFIVFDYLKNSQFKFIVFDYLLNIYYLTFKATVKYKKNSNNLIIFPTILQSLDVKGLQCNIICCFYKSDLFHIKYGILVALLSIQDIC